MRGGGRGLIGELSRAGRRWIAEGKDGVRGNALSKGRRSRNGLLGRLGRGDEKSEVAGDAALQGGRLGKQILHFYLNCKNNKTEKGEKLLHKQQIRIPSLPRRLVMRQSTSRVQQARQPQLSDGIQRGKRIANTSMNWFKDSIPVKEQLFVGEKLLVPKLPINESSLPCSLERERDGPFAGKGSLDT